MRIALLTNGLPPMVKGGMQQYALNMSRALADLGVEIDLYTTCNEPRSTITDLFTTSQNKHIRVFTTRWPNHLRLPGHYVRESREISHHFSNQLFSGDPVDLIYGHGLMNWGLAQARSQGTRTPPLISHGHGYEMFQQAATIVESLKQRLLRPSFLKILRNSDYVVSLGGKLNCLLQDKVSIHPSKIIQTPVAVERQWVDTPDSQRHSKLQRRRVTYLGRFERRKGIEELAAVCRELAPLSFDLHLIGPIPNTGIETFPREVIAHGPIYNTGKLIRLLDQSDILVCPSWSEGMPTVILEAMSRKNAILATDVGAVSDIVSATNGWIFKAGNRQILREKLLEAIATDDDNLKSMQLKSRERICREFTWPHIARKMFKQFELIKNTDTADKKETP